MSTFEIIISFFGSGVFLALIAMFYRMGSNHKEIDLFFKHVDQRFENIDKDLQEIRTDIKDIRKDISRIDREVGIITATLRFNGFDLARHKAEGE